MQLQKILNEKIAFKLISTNFLREKYNRFYYKQPSY